MKKPEPLMKTTYLPTEPQAVLAGDATVHYCAALRAAAERDIERFAEELAGARGACLLMASAMRDGSAGLPGHCWPANAVRAAGVIPAELAEYHWPRIARADRAPASVRTHQGPCEQARELEDDALALLGHLGVNVAMSRISHTLTPATPIETDATNRETIALALAATTLRLPADRRAVIRELSAQLKTRCAEMAADAGMSPEEARELSKLPGLAD